MLFNRFWVIESLETGIFIKLQNAQKLNNGVKHYPKSSYSMIILMSEVLKNSRKINRFFETRKVDKL
jgi:hypothetical protein